MSAYPTIKPKMALAYLAAIFFFFLVTCFGAAQTEPTQQCGEQGVAFLKLHKVGSTTIANALQAYADRHGLQVCPEKSAVSEVQDCDVVYSHAGPLSPSPPLTFFH
jgi:hypothetical protein